MEKGIGAQNHKSQEDTAQLRQDIASHSHHGRLRAVVVFAAFLLLTGGNAYAQGSVATDRAALVALYNATDGANWTNNTNWLSNEALSKWYGIRTDASGRVEQLSLIQNELSGTIPAALVDLTHLQKLFLMQNTLSGTIPAALGNMTSLLVLALDQNELSGTIPVELGNMTSLQQLSLAVNMLSGTIPVELGKLTNLQILYLQSNELSGTIPVELGNMTSLRHLSLWSNELSGTIPVELGNLTNLQQLYLSQNELSGTIPVELGNLTSLQQLYLSQNELSGTIPVELGNLTNLQRLYLSQNELSGTIPVELGNLTNLQRLSLWSNELSGTIPVELGNLTNLQRLYLSQNELSGTIPVELGNLTNLQRLYLSQNELSGTIPVELGNLTNLQRLSLWSNELSGTIPVELGNLTNLQQLSLSQNTLSGTIPVEMGNLTNIQELKLNGNTDLTGPLPRGLMDLDDLTTVWIQDTGLCAPEDTAFQAWLATITFQGSVCGASQPPGGPPPPRPPPPPPPPRPDAPRNLLVEGGDGQVTLTWEAPEDDGGSAITDYEYRINGRGSWTSIGSTLTIHTVTGLNNGTVYVFQVRAVNRNRKSRASNRVEATPRMPVTLDFTHFANGTWITGLVLVNVGPHPIQPAIYFYDQGGHLIAPDSVVDITGDLEITQDGALTVWTAMEPLGVLTISTHGRGERVSGSVKVVSDGPLGGMLRFAHPEVGVAGVGASPPFSAALVPVRRQAGGIHTGMALHNLGKEPMEVSCQLMSGGVAVEETIIPLAANGQDSRFIEEVFPNADTSDFVGSVRCTAPFRGRFTEIAVDMDDAGGIFTTLTVVEGSRGRPEATTLDFTHFANGTWITDLVFVNLETRQSGPPLTPFHTVIPPTRPAIYFYDTEGNPIAPDLVVDITGDLEITEDGALTVRTEMEPLGVLTISTHGRGELVSGSVRVVSEGPIGGMLRFEHPDFGVAGAGASQPLSDALFPVRRQEGGITTGVALHNLESSPGLLRCDLMREGVLLDAASIPLEANGQTSWFIDQAFPATDTSDFAGAVRCDAVGEDRFTAVALEMDPGNRIFTTLTVFPVPEMPDRE